MKKIILAPAVALLCAASAMAQDSEPKFTIKPTGRILMDGAVYLGGNDDIEGTSDKKFVDGVAIPDLRIGVKAG